MALSRSSLALILGIPLAFMTAFFIAPLGIVLVESFLNTQREFSLANYARLFSDSYYWWVLWLTIRVSLVTVFFTILIGYPLAYYITFYVKNKNIKSLCYIIIVVPLFTSNIVRAFGWIVILGRDGIFNDTLRWLGIINRPIQMLYSETSVVIGLCYIMTPFMTLTIATVLQNIHPSLREASRDLGAGAWSTFLRVTLPLSIPGVIAGSLIVFTLSVSGYVTPSVMSGGKFAVMPMLIFEQYATVFNPHFGAALAIALLIATLFLTTIYSGILEKKWGAR